MFTESCYIRIESDEMRERIVKKLGELGYKVMPSFTNFTHLSTKKNGYAIPSDGLNRDGDFDCGNNEKLFLALAALRDDSDYHQWFWEPDGYKMALFMGDNIKRNIYNIIGWGCHRKATKEELIKYFGN